ncbi:MAG: DUF4199 family protein, partial [Pseudomonadota bacterium]
MSMIVSRIVNFGLISGLITIGLTIGWTMLDSSGGPLGVPIGYLIMFVAMSLIFVGVKQFRDVERGGVVRFGTASLVGLAIAVLAALVYAAVWEAYMALTDYAFVSD